MNRVLRCLFFSTIAACSVLPRGYDDRSHEWRQRTAHVVLEPTGAPVGQESTLSELLAWADRHNPGIAAAAQGWRAALEEVPQSVSLPDPRLSLGYFLEEVETRTGPMDYRVGLSQSFPWFGSLDLAGRVALERAAAAGERFEATRLDVARRVRDAWHEYAYVHTAIDVTRGHRDLLSSWEEVARIRYSTGLGTEADVIRAQVELGKLDDRVRTLQDLRLPVAARLNALLDRAADAPLPVPGLDGPAPVAVDGATLRADLTETSPLLRSMRRQVQAAELRIALADKAYYPDLALGLDYTAISSARNPGVRDSGDDALALTAGISLPLRRGRIDAAARQAEAESASAKAALRETFNGLAADLELALYRLRDAQRRVALFRDTLVSKGRESVESTNVAYRADDADFLDLVDAERVLLEFQLAAARAQADHAQALAEVERLTGVPLHAPAQAEDR